jgi:hypothetical protein
MRQARWSGDISDGGGRAERNDAAEQEIGFMPAMVAPKLEAEPASSYSSGQRRIVGQKIM